MKITDDVTKYKLSYGTFWILVDEKPTLTKRLYCFVVGSLVELWPITLSFMLALLFIFIGE